LKLAFTGIHTDINFDVNDSVNVRVTGVTPRSTSITNKNLHKYVFSTEYTWKDLVLSGEYMMQDFDANSTATVYRTATGTTTTNSVPTKRDSWYLSATYRINDYVELGSYYNEYYGNRDNRNSNYQKDAAATVRIDPLKYLVVKVEGHYMKGSELLITPFNTRDWYMFASKVTFSF